MHSSPSRIFVLSLLGLLAVCTLCEAEIYWGIYGYAKLFGDFATFHAAALHIVAHELRAVYAIDEVRQLADSHTLKDFRFFLNPPTGLFVVYPFGLLSRTPALALWSLGQLLLLWAALRTAYIRRLFAPTAASAVSTPTLLAIVFLAFCLQNLLYGQLATFCATLFILVLTLRQAHPIVSGVVLGIFSFKPQLGILLPLLLLAEGNTKALLSAIVTALLMACLSLAFWGDILWKDYMDMLSLRGHFMAEDPDLLFILSTSIYAALRILGVPTHAALVCQAEIAAVTLISIWPVLRKGKESDKILMLTLATYLVTPYSLVYDMVLLAIPCCLLLRRAEANFATRSELIALLFLILMPVVTVLLQIAHIPYSVIAIGSALIVARRLALKGMGHGVVSA